MPPVMAPNSGRSSSRKRRDLFALRSDPEIENAIRKALNELFAFHKRSLPDQRFVLDSASLILADAMFHHIRDAAEELENESEMSDASPFEACENSRAPYPKSESSPQKSPVAGNSIRTTNQINLDMTSASVRAYNTSQPSCQTPTMQIRASQLPSYKTGPVIRTDLQQPNSMEQRSSSNLPQHSTVLQEGSERKILSSSYAVLDKKSNSQTTDTRDLKSRELSSRSPHISPLRKQPKRIATMPKIYDVEKKVSVPAKKRRIFEFAAAENVCTGTENETCPYRHSEMLQDSGNALQIEDTAPCDTNEVPTACKRGKLSHVVKNVSENGEAENSEGEDNDDDVPLCRIRARSLDTSAIRKSRPSKAAMPRKSSAPPAQTVPRDKNKTDEETETDQEADAKVPWWRRAVNINAKLAVDISSETLQSHFSSLLPDFISALTWACVSNECSSAQLLDDHKFDSSSKGGTLYSVVANVLGMLEFARSTEKCAAEWSPELVTVLQERPIVCWKSIDYDPSFQQFAGCEVCCRHSPAKQYLWACGKRYDAKSHWPEACSFQIISSESSAEGRVRVVVELLDSCAGSEIAPVMAREGQARVAVDVFADDTEEFWVDTRCLWRCLIYHELTHCVAKVSAAIRHRVLNELRKAHFNLSSQVDHCDENGYKTGSTDVVQQTARLEKHLVDLVVGNREFMQELTEWLEDVHSCGLSHLRNDARRGTPQLSQKRVYRTEFPHELFAASKFDSLSSNYVSLRNHKTGAVCELNASQGNQECFVPQTEEDEVDAFPSYIYDSETDLDCDQRLQSNDSDAPQEERDSISY